MPSLVGVLGQMITSIMEKRKNKDKSYDVSNLEGDEDLSAGEKAMKDANNSLGKGLYNEREAEGFAILAEALANSDEPDDDPYSMGDNEGSGQSSDINQDYDNEDYEDAGGYEEEADNPWDYPEDPAEAEKQLKDWMDDPYAGYSEETLEEIRQANGGVLPENNPYLPWEDPYEDFPIETWKTRNIIDNSTGQPMEIKQDPLTGEWINPESGNGINLETYEKDVLPGLERDAATIAKHRLDNLKSDPELVKAMAKIRLEEHQQSQLIKLQRKYGQNLTEEEIRTTIKKEQFDNTKEFQEEMERADFYGKMQLGAELVQIGADIGIDMLAEVTGPAGKSMKYAYTGLKGYAGAATEDYIKDPPGKRNFWKSSMVGVAKGGGDLYKAGVGDIAGQGKGYIKYAGQAVANVGGNLITTIGNAAANGSKDFKGDLTKAFKDGIVETGLGAAFDYMGGDGAEYSKTAKNYLKNTIKVTYKNGKKAIVGQAKGFTTNYVNSKIDHKMDSTNKISTGSDLMNMLFLGSEM